MRAYHQRNRDVLLAKHREYWRATNDARLEHQRRYQAANKDDIRRQQAEYRKRNIDLIAARNRLQYLKNKPERLEYAKRWNAEQRRNDPLFRLKANLRTRTGDAIRAGGYTKLSSMNEALGCDWQTLKRHLESHFAEWMTWDNYGEWVVDHHIPLASATSSEEVKALCHYTNLRPLGRLENLQKGASIPETGVIS